MYQFVFAHKHHSNRKIVIRGVGKVNGINRGHVHYHNQKLTEKMLNDYQMNFQLMIITHHHCKIRMFNFFEKIFGHSKIISTGGLALAVTMMAVIKRAPLLAIDIEKDKLSEKAKLHLSDLLQVLHGVQIQLEDKNLKETLKIATKYEVLNVKRYCEIQLIRREDLELSEKWKFKMGCKYSLNILINQVLRNVKTVKKLVKLASIAVEIRSMDTNISKLLIAKMYQLF